MSNGIGKVGITQDRDCISFWNVYLPYGVDRDVYIKNCYATGTVTIINENSEILNRVKIGRVALQEVDFPVDQENLGSGVICVTLPYSGELRVIEVYDNDNQYTAQQEGQYRLIKIGSGVASILIDGSGNISISVNGDKDNGTVLLNVTNSDRVGKLLVNVNGDIIVQNDGNTTFQSSKQVLIDAPKIYLNDSKEPILLGNKTVKMLEDILQQLSKESAGPYTLRGQTVYAQLKEKLNELKSEISFVK